MLLTIYLQSVALESDTRETSDTTANLNTRRAMRPTLVIAPSAVMGVWRDEIAKYFGTALSLKVFHGDPAHLRDMAEKERTLKPDGLVE